MIKCEVIKEFTLEKFNELKNIQRRRINTYGKLYDGDTFECTKEMADYLMGNNKDRQVVVKVIEIIPEKEKPIGESIQPIEKVVEEIGKNQLEKTITEKPKIVQNKATKKKHSKK